MKAGVLTTYVVFGTALIGCGAAKEGASEGAAAAASQATTASEADAQAADGAVDDGQSAGSVTFEVDGKAKRFDQLAPDVNFYAPWGARIKAKPSADSPEQLLITFLSMDLRKKSYPADLPAPKDPSKPLDAASMMASVGFSYTDGQGREWAGPGKIHVESFGDDLIIDATFSGVSLPQTDDKLPDIVLDHGTVNAKLHMAVRGRG